MESEQQIMQRTRIRPSENRRWLQSHVPKVPHAYVPERPTVSRRIDLKSDITVIDLTKPIPEVLVELPPKVSKPRFGKRLLQGIKNGLKEGAEWVRGHKRQLVGAVAMTGVISVAFVGPENQPPEQQAAANSATVAVYNEFSAQQPGVSYAEFDEAINSQEFANMSQWANENPGQDFADAMSNFN